MPPKDAASLAKLFKGDARANLRQDARRAAKDAGVSDEIAEFLGSLSAQEIDTLTKTWDHMERHDVTGKADGVTVAFL